MLSPHYTPALAERVPISHCYSEIRDRTETLPGVSRLEACRPLAAEALHLGLMPTIHQMRCVITRPHSQFCSSCGHRLPWSQRSWYHCDSGNDEARDPRWIRRGAGHAAADDHHIHDLCFECALLYHRQALGTEGVCGL